MPSETSMKDDPRYICHEVALQCAMEGEYDVIMLENVPEYAMEEQCARLRAYDWKISRNVDPRRFGYHRTSTGTYPNKNNQAIDWISLILTLKAFVLIV
jgi:hypothetical protein